jgi:hypothetical protein
MLQPRKLTLMDSWLAVLPSSRSSLTSAGVLTFECMSKTATERTRISRTMVGLRDPDMVRCLRMSTAIGCDVSIRLRYGCQSQTCLRTVQKTSTILIFDLLASTISSMRLSLRALILRHSLVSQHSPDLPTILNIFGCCDTLHRRLRGPNDPAHPTEGF